MARRECGGARVVVPLRLCARSRWCVAYSSSSLPYRVPPLASGALLACSRSCGFSVGGSLGRSCFPYLVGRGVWPPSVLLSLHTFLLLLGVSYCVYVFGCMAYLALLAAACVNEYSMGIPFAPYAGVRGWACSLGYTSLVTFVGAVIVVLFPPVWCCVACNILVLVLAHGCPWWQHVCAYAGGIPFCSCLYSAAAVVVVACACLFFVFCFCVCCTFRCLCVAPSVRSSYHSFTRHAPSYHFAFPR